MLFVALLRILMIIRTQIKMWHPCRRSRMSCLEPSLVFLSRDIHLGRNVLWNMFYFFFNDDEFSVFYWAMRKSCGPYYLYEGVTRQVSACPESTCRQCHSSHTRSRHKSENFTFCRISQPFKYFSSLTCAVKWELGSSIQSWWCPSHWLFVISFVDISHASSMWKLIFVCHNTVSYSKSWC